MRDFTGRDPPGASIQRYVERLDRTILAAVGADHFAVLPFSLVKTS